MSELGYSWTLRIYKPRRPNLPTCTQYSTVQYMRRKCIDRRGQVKEEGPQY